MNTDKERWHYRIAYFGGYRDHEEGNNAGDMFEYSLAIIRVCILALVGLVLCASAVGLVTSVVLSLFHSWVAGEWLVSTLGTSFLYASGIVVLWVLAIVIVEECLKWTKTGRKPRQ